MSLTETSEVFVAVEESALNDLITAVCTTRPHLLHYGSPAFVPASSISATQMAPIPFPGSPGLQWSVELTTPQLDLFDQDQPLPPELTLGPGQFSLSTTVRLCVDCNARGKGDPAGDANGDSQGDTRGDTKGGDTKGGDTKDRQASGDHHMDHPGDSAETPDRGGRQWPDDR